jgi:hypothetical protein
MAARTKRRLELLALAEPLRRYAGRIQSDQNASFMLVHQALSAALREPPEARDGQGLEATLRHDIDRRFAGPDS